MAEHYDVFLSYAQADAAQVHSLAENFHNAGLLRGKIVGRRREKRQILQALSRNDRAGVVLHGLGGVGKSSLSAKVLRKLLEERWLVASVHGEIAPDDLLEEVGKCYLAAFQQEGVSEADPRRQLDVFLRRQDRDWEESFDLLSRVLLGNRPLILLLDNFEDNLVDGGLGPSLKSEDLADLLARWVRNPGRTRLLFASRPPFELPDRAHRRLEALHLGPLSFVETRKLLWRLPGLDALQREDQLRAYTDVGGHPRALEYLDVLLRGGESRFPDVAERMESALEKKGIRKPEAWLRRVKGNLDQALAEAVTLAVDDVLVDGLLEKLEGVPLAKELLLGASVYRPPVDFLGLAWQVGEEIEIPEDQERGERIKALRREINRARGRSEEPSPELLERFRAELAEWRRPPLAVPEGFQKALEVLGSLGLLAPVQWSDTPGAARFAVHRWTASAVLRRGSEDAVRQVHHRAARYWRWRVDRVPQSQQESIAQLLEARHHYREAGDVDQAVEVTEWICTQLTWGSSRREEQLRREVLTWLPERSTQAAAFLHQLGMLAQLRGAYDEALDSYKRALQINEALGNQAGMASSYHQLGMIAEKRGSYAEALDCYKRSFQIKEELSKRSSMASSYGQRGRMAQLRGAYDEALDWYKKSFQIKEELGDREGMARSYHQLGILAQLRGVYDEALDWYKRSLQIKKERGNRTGMAITFGQMAALRMGQGYSEEALALTLQSLAIHMELQSPNVMTNLHGLHRQQELLGEERFGELLREHVGDEGAEAVLGLMDQAGTISEPGAE
jgi:tetratricopeptide (TPR) repeat protein